MGPEGSSLKHIKNNQMDRFMEVSLLVLLREQTGYGYGLIEDLARFGFDPAQLNVSTLYRSLRKMEQEGLVRSKWEAGGQGPRRRVYEITATGEQELVQWIAILKMRKQGIEYLIRRYDKIETTGD